MKNEKLIEKTLIGLSGILTSYWLVKRGHLVTPTILAWKTINELSK